MSARSALQDANPGAKPGSIENLRRVAFIRHGDYHQQEGAPSALQPHPLTDKGEHQAREGAREVLALCATHGWRPERVLHASSLLRAWQTARLMGEALGAAQSQSSDDGDTHDFTQQSHDVLWERQLGSAANLTTQQIARIARLDPRVGELPPDWKSSSRYRLPLPGAESLMQAGERVAAFVRALPPPATNEAVTLVIGHGAAFRHAAHLLGVLEFEQIARLSMYHARPVILQESATGQWQHVAGDWKVRQRHDQAKD